MNQPYVLCEVCGEIVARKLAFCQHRFEFAVYRNVCPTCATYPYTDAEAHRDNQKRGHLAFVSSYSRQYECQLAGGAA